ncbi:MAG: outer membrane protein assembly factor BamD [Candidatus Zixiibacteriota bacterium]
MSIPVRFFVVCTSLLSLALALNGCGGAVSLTDKGPHELFEMGLAQYEKGRYYKAIELFQAVVYNYPGDPVVDTAQYYLGLSYFGNKDYELAGVEFNRLAANYPSSAFFEHAIFMRAVSFFESTPKHYGLDQSDLEKAIQQFEDVIIDFPESDLVPDARKYLLKARTRMAKKYYSSGVVYSRMQAYDAAKVYFQKVIDEFTDTEFGAQATYKYAEMDYRLGNYDDAHKRFRDFTVVFPNHKWVDKARKRAVESAFRSAEQAYRQGDYALAQQRLEKLQQEYPNNGYTDKIEDYLREIRDITRQNTHTNETES